MNAFRRQVSVMKALLGSAGYEDTPSGRHVLCKPCIDCYERTAYRHPNSGCARVSYIVRVAACAQTLARCNCTPKTVLRPFNFQLSGCTVDNLIFALPGRHAATVNYNVTTLKEYYYFQRAMRLFPFRVLSDC